MNGQSQFNHFIRVFLGMLASSPLPPSLPRRRAPDLTPAAFPKFVRH
jgi:hypothetical protein